MKIEKFLDYSEHVALNLNFNDEINGQVLIDKELEISLKVNGADINWFQDNFAQTITVKIDDTTFIPYKNKNGNFTINNLPENYNEMSIYAGEQLLAKYNVEKEPILEKEVLLDSYFIKNSILNKEINTKDIVETNFVAKTDLHTHYAGAPTAKGLINVAIEHNIDYPTFLLKELNIPYPENITTIKLNQLKPEDLQVLESAMQIAVGGQIRFSGEDDNLEKIYKFRQPFFRDSHLTKIVLELIAKEYSQNGVEYVELSGSQIFDLEKEPQMLKLATEIIPELEEKYGIKIRFLGAMTRFDDKEWSLDQLEKIKQVAYNPYIAGMDIVGHETNSTLDIVDNIEPYMIFAKENNINWTFRFHAGENPSHPENVKEALKLADKYNVAVRIGHGLYGIDEETIALAKKTGAIIEINSSSNLSLNNVQDVNDMQPLIHYLKSGIPVVLGTDSPGIYQTTSQQEVVIATRLLKKNNVDISLLNNIGIIENKVINDRKKEETILAQHTDYKNVPDIEVFKNLTTCWSPQVSQLKEKTRQDKFDLAIAKINSLDSQYIKCENITQYLKQKNKTPFVISGASKSNWKTLTDQEKNKITLEIETLMDKLDPAKYIIVTGGTDYGVEEIVHNLAGKKKIEVLGVLTEDLSIDEIKNTNIQSFTVIKGNWWAKSAFVMNNIIKPSKGKVLFAAGGAIVSDEIVSGIYNKLSTDDMFLLNEVGGASSIKAKQNPQYNISSVEEVLDKLNKPKNILLDKIKTFRKSATHVSNNQIKLNF